METDATGKAGGGGGNVEPEGTRGHAAPDSGGNGTLQPGEAHPDVGEEDYTLVRVTSKQGGQKLNQLTGALEVWEVRHEYIPKEPE